MAKAPREKAPPKSRRAPATEVREAADGPKGSRILRSAQAADGPKGSRILRSAQAADGPKGSRIQTETRASALVGLVMGSDSDWETLKPAADLLARSNVTFDVAVTSAHRTPERMVAYAKEARLRGFRVI